MESKNNAVDFTGQHVRFCACDDLIANYIANQSVTQPCNVTSYTVKCGVMNCTAGSYS